MKPYNVQLIIQVQQEKAESTKETIDIQKKKYRTPPTIIQQQNNNQFNKCRNISLVSIKLKR